MVSLLLSYTVLSFLTKRKSFLTYEKTRYKVEKKTMATCCNTLRNKVLAKLPMSNLGQFSVEIRRIGTSDWLDLQVYTCKKSCVYAYVEWPLTC